MTEIMTDVKCTRVDCRFNNVNNKTCQFKSIIITKEGCYYYEQNALERAISKKKRREKEKIIKEGLLATY